MHKQNEHFDSINEIYKSHYYDEYALKYRRDYIYKPMFSGWDFNNCLAAELACGSGYNSREFLSLFQGVEIEGYDISAKACQDYLKLVHQPCHCIDLKSTKLPKEKYQLVFVIGGLHHCHDELGFVLENVARSLQKNGIFIMVEPNSRYILECLRMLWYLFDGYIDPNESSIDYFRLYTAGKKWFKQIKIRYMGGLAYFFILNSLYFRLPFFIKKNCAPLLFKLEDLNGKLKINALFPVFIAHWQKKS